MDNKFKKEQFDMEIKVKYTTHLGIESRTFGG